MEIKVKALKEFIRSGLILFKVGRKYLVKEYLNRYFYPSNSKHKILVPVGVLEELKELE